MGAALPSLPNYLATTYFFLLSIVCRQSSVASRQSSIETGLLSNPFYLDSPSFRSSISPTLPRPFASIAHLRASVDVVVVVVVVVSQGNCKRVGGGGSEVEVSLASLHDRPVLRFACRIIRLGEDGRFAALFLDNRRRR